MVLERRTREYVMGRVRAGSARAGHASTCCGRVALVLASTTKPDARRHVLSCEGRQIRIDFKALTGKTVTIYGQTRYRRTYSTRWRRRGTAW